MADNNSSVQDISKIKKSVIRTALDLGAVQLRPEDPFTWASGYRMPIYNDNRLLLSVPSLRRDIARAMGMLLEDIAAHPTLVAGVATAGIPWATTLADSLELPLVYVRSQAKGHGMQNTIEGKYQSEDQAVIVEDLLSTGGSAVKALQALRMVGVKVDVILSVFSYGFEECAKAFASVDCRVEPLVSFSELVKEALEIGYIGEVQYQLLKDWYKDPYQYSPTNT